MDDLISISVSNQRGTNDTFDVTSVGFDTEKRYTVAEFNQALKQANKIWEENWDGLSYPHDIAIITVENLHAEPCAYRINLADAEFNSIQDIVELSPTPMHASISTDEAIERLNKQELRDTERSTTMDEKVNQRDRTFAYDIDISHSAPFIVVHLDIGTEERKNAVSHALKNIINVYTDDNGRTLDTAQPYKNLLEDIKSDMEFVSASQGHLSCLKYALGNALESKELCAVMLDSIKHAEKNLKVMSDHADKSAEENIDRGERITSRFADDYDYGNLHTKAESIPQTRDSSHKQQNAVLSAKRREQDVCAIAPKAAQGRAATEGNRGESRGLTMENTKFEMSSISKLEGDGKTELAAVATEAQTGRLRPKATGGKAKAIGTLVVNGEFAIHGVRVTEGKNGLFASMPSEKDGYTGLYKDVVFPVTKEARAAIDDAVLGAYEKLMASPEKTLKNNVETPEKATSKVYAQMHTVDSQTSQTKAAGQITIDDCLVVTGVKVNEGVNQEGQKKTFVSMPGKPNGTGGFDNIANPITKDFHNKVEKSVIASANNIGRYEYKGVKYEELGENPARSAPMHPKFADKLMAELDKKGIPYQAKCAETVTISVKASDKQTFESERKNLVAKLNGKDKKAPAHTQEKKAGTHKSVI